MDEPIELTWSQQLAASWSLTWPVLLGPWVLILIIAVIGYDTDWIQAHPTLAWVFSTLCFLASQSVLVFRLVRKNYRSFWIGVLKDGESPARKLKPGNAARVWFQFVWPQAAFLLAVYIFFFWFGSNIEPERVQGINTIGQLVRILVVGPIAIRCVMYATYPGFRLQAYRRNRWSDPRPAEPDAVSES